MEELEQVKKSVFDSSLLKKKVHAREVRDQSRKGRLFGRWKNRVKEYMYERGAGGGGR